MNDDEKLDRQYPGTEAALQTAKEESVEFDRGKGLFADGRTSSTSL